MICLICTVEKEKSVALLLWHTSPILSMLGWFEFAKSRAMRANMVYVPMCQLLIFMCQRANERVNVPKPCQFSNLACQRAKRCANFSILLAKGISIFQAFFKRILEFWVFHLCLTFAIFNNIWAILANLSWETKILNFDICKISLRKNLINLKPLTPFSMKHVELTEHLLRLS